MVGWCFSLLWLAHQLIWFTEKELYTNKRSSINNDKIRSCRENRRHSETWIRCVQYVRWNKGFPGFRNQDMMFTHANTERICQRSVIIGILMLSWLTVGAFRAWMETKLFCKNIRLADEKWKLHVNMKAEKSLTTSKVHFSESLSFIHSFITSLLVSLSTWVKFTNYEAVFCSSFQ